MTDLRALLAPIRARLEVITPLPWIDWDRGIGHEIRDQYGEPINSGHRETFSARDAAFIANAPTDLTRLLAAIEAVIGEIADTDLETNEALQGDLADRILGVIAAALGSDTTNQEGTP